MKIRKTMLVLSLLLSSILVAGFGTYLKYAVIRPLDIAEYGDKSVMELPFLYFSDPVLKVLLEDSQVIAPTQPQPTDPSVTPSSSETSSTAPTEPTNPDAPVDESWFEDVLFIGDSRTVGLRDYARSGNADYFCDVGMTVFNLHDKTLEDKQFSKQSLTELLGSQKYGKVFINLGLNEAGWPSSSFQKRYQQLVELVQQLQPDAIVVLQGIMSVSRSKAASQDYFSLENLNSRNQFIQSLSNEQTIFYIDANEEFTDEDGYLLEELSNDGYHPTGEAYRLWRDWIAVAVGRLGIWLS